MGNDRNTDKPEITLRSLRDAMNLKQADVAAAIGVHENTIRAWERRTKIAAADKFWLLAQLYKVDLETLNEKLQRSPDS
ncbi:MAG TPA: helix-turn-helix transcriptional regulator [Oscillatoriales cyanobacterium M59_W2019_021]|nr:MAG: XRE family transcriptional regulator [Cyanobacteria bacterium J055]HIK32114.1 helix-turn-helix transcriptional regulator [Oscillatoriales cyanobacterium M4454_W2019_049]HIK50772.1 helix-turn-helix transcriptional regulator [Oscillatoriales cyanobacterium M59_W2019_021]